MRPRTRWWWTAKKESEIKNYFLFWRALILTKLKNPLNRFPFKFSQQLGTGGFATVYKGLFHGVERAFKVIPLDEDEHKYNIESYGCHEYYNQENGLKSTTT